LPLHIVQPASDAVQPTAEGLQLAVAEAPRSQIVDTQRAQQGSQLIAAAHQPALHSDRVTVPRLGSTVGLAV
ncbi:hypothetical protein DK853_50710, partial [Klebsiella oxytoca]